MAEVRSSNLLEPISFYIIFFYNKTYKQPTKFIKTNGNCEDGNTSYSFSFSIDLKSSIEENEKDILVLPSLKTASYIFCPLCAQTFLKYSDGGALNGDIMQEL